MATTVTFDFGSIYGPVVESPKTDLGSLSYGSLYGPVVGVAAGGGNVKTLQGLAWASAKTLNGVAAANVKAIMGVPAQ
jgi:hypothetical protein